MRGELEVVAGIRPLFPLGVGPGVRKAPAEMARAVLQAWEALTPIREMTPVADHARVLELRADALTRRRAWEIPGEVADAVGAEGATVDFPEFVALVEGELGRTRFRVHDRRWDAVNASN